jgi:superfamily II DNA or RNA helicase
MGGNFILLQVMNDILQTIEKLIQDNDRKGLKSYFDNIPDIIKGKVFETFISDLYNGNGWITEIKGSRNDKGADIIVRHPSEPCKVKFIIQAKNHKTKLTKKDTQAELNQFISEASKYYKCNQYRLISINGFVEDAYHYQKYNLRLEDWRHIECLLDNYKRNKQEAPDISLHSHNKITYEKVIDLWKTIKRVAIIQATGTGKSYLIFKAISDFIGKNKILIAPSNVIINQFKENPDYGWLIDKTVNTFLYHNKKKFSDEKIHGLKADLIILDEFHRVGAKMWEKKIKKLLQQNNDAFVLGTTATPIRYLDGKRDMCDDLFFGNKANELTLPQAIVKKILPNPKYIASLITLQEEINYLLSDLNNSRLSYDEKEEIRKELLQRNLDWEKSKGVPELLKKHLVNTNLNKFLVFCEGIEHLDKMEIEVEGWFQKAGFRNRSKYRIHSKQNIKKNKEIVEIFQNDNSENISLLFAVDMLNEGIHIENVDGVILLRRTESPIIFYQQIGRCLQVGNDNPIIFDLVNNFSNIRANDFLQDLNEVKSKEQKELEADGIIVDIPEFHVIDETKEIVELLDRIGERLNDWVIGYNILREYYVINKHSSPRNHEKFKGENIGYWVSRQRRNKYRRTLDQIQKLDEIEFDWGEDRKMGSFDRLAINRRNLKALEDYYNYHKTCRVPMREPKSEESKKFWSKKLSIFFHQNLKQRLIYDYEKDKEYFTYEYKGKLIPMIDFLNLIRIQDSTRRKVVLVAINRLEEEHKKNPNFGQDEFAELVSYDKKFFKSVVNKLRNYYSGVVSPGKEYFLPGEIEKLESLGWSWRSKDEKTWNDQFEELKKIYQKSGNYNFKQEDNFSLYQWCKGQRQKKHLLLPEQIAKLDAIDFPWVVTKKYKSYATKQDKKFEEYAKELLKYRDENGEFKINSRSKIGNWITKLKYTGTSDERRKILLQYGYDIDKEISKTIAKKTKRKIVNNINLSSA